MPSRSLPPILRIPLELRQQIYDYLLPRGNVSHPLPSVGITSVSHRPPPSSLLKIHPQLSEEILDYFYSISTWKLVFSHAFNFFRVDPDLRKLEASPALQRIRKVEVVFFCDVLLLQQYPSFGLESFCKEIRRRAARACEVLQGARDLRSVVVSWCDSTEMGGWEEKAKILEPLRELRGVVFRIGKITGPDDFEKEDFVKALRDTLGAEGRLALDSGDDTESSLRMLAFDVRQERHKLAASGYPLPAVGRSGWGGAPPALEVPREEHEE